MPRTDIAPPRTVSNVRIRQASLEVTSLVELYLARARDSTLMLMMMMISIVCRTSINHQQDNSTEYRLLGTDRLFYQRPMVKS